MAECGDSGVNSNVISDDSDVSVNVLESDTDNEEDDEVDSSSSNDSCRIIAGPLAKKPKVAYTN